MRSIQEATPADNHRPHISDTLLWQHACESFMAGLFHSIGSRVSALSGIATMAGMGEELDGTLLSLLEDEVEHLTDILESSRSLPRGPSTLIGPSQVAVLVPRVLRLVELSLDSRGLNIEYEGPDSGAAVELDETTITHSLAVLLACLCWRSLETGAERLEIRLEAEGSSVEFRAQLSAATGEDQASPHENERTAPWIPSPDVVQEGLESIAATNAACEGSLELGIDFPPSSFVYRLPRLGRG